MKNNPGRPGRSRARFLLIITAMIWGGTFPVIKGGLADASPLMLMGCRFVLAFLVFSALSFRSWRKISRAALKDGLALGLLMFLGYALQTIGLTETTASRSGFITYTYALYTPFIQLAYLKKRPGLAHILGLAVVFAGFFVMSRPGGGTFNRGDLLTLGGALAMAFYVVFMDKVSKRTDNSLLVILQFFVCGVLSLALSPLTETPFVNWTASLAVALVYLVLLGSAAATYIMTRYQREMTPTQAVLLYSLEPFFALVFAFLFAGERPGPWEITGCVLILAGVVFAELMGSRAAGKSREAAAE